MLSCDRVCCSVTVIIMWMSPFSVHLVDLVAYGEYEEKLKANENHKPLLVSEKETTWTIYHLSP